MNLFSEIEFNLSGIIEYLIENFSKIVAVFFSIIIKEIILRVYNKVKFIVQLKQLKQTSDQLKSIQSVCDIIRGKTGCDRALYFGIHNGETTITNMHLAKVSCFGESVNDGISNIKDEAQNISLPDFSDYFNYFIRHRVMICNEIENYPDEAIQLKFTRRGVKSFFVVIVGSKKLATGFIRIEFCHKRNHNPDEINALLEILNHKAKKLYAILKP